MKATDSLCYYDENGEEIAFFVSDKDGISEMRRMVDKTGKMIENYIGMHKIGLLIYARIAEGINAERLVTAIMQSGSGDYIIDDIVDRVEGGGYLVDKYKEYVYANAVYTNLKGYITTALNYTALFVDNEYAKTYLSEHPVITKGSQDNNFNATDFTDFDFGTPSDTEFENDLDDEQVNDSFGNDIMAGTISDATKESITNTSKTDNEMISESKEETIIETTAETKSENIAENVIETSQETEKQETTTTSQDEEINTATSEPS